jgi:multicomponent Na+:H+ antiporter subunit G
VIVLDVLSGVLLVSGCLLALLAGVGLVRFPDVFARMHAATKPATLGLVLVAFGAVLRVDHASDVTKLLLVVALQFLTAPVGAHLVGRAAYWAGGALDPSTDPDDLADLAPSRPPSAPGSAAT